jgi:hypothetical protein
MEYLCFAKTLAGLFFGVSGLVPPFAPDSLYAKSNHAPGARTAVCGQDLFAALSGDTWNRSVGAATLEHRITGTMPRASRTGGEDRRLPGFRSRFPSPLAAQDGSQANPSLTQGTSSIDDSSSRSAARFASGVLPRVRRRDQDTPGAGSRSLSPHTGTAGTAWCGDNLLDVERLHLVGIRETSCRIVRIMAGECRTSGRGKSIISARPRF